MDQTTTARPVALAEPHFPSTIEQPGATACPSLLLMTRVGRVLQDIAAARVVSDAEIRQHAADCTALMERCYAQYTDSGNTDLPAREEACQWMHRRDEAHHMLSPAWKAAREAEILQAIGAGYFIDQADRDRLAVAGRAIGA